MGCSGHLSVSGLKVAAQGGRGGLGGPGGGVVVRASRKCCSAAQQEGCVLPNRPRLSHQLGLLFALTGRAKRVRVLIAGRESGADPAGGRHLWGLGRFTGPVRTTSHRARAPNLSMAGQHTTRRLPAKPRTAAGCTGRTRRLFFKLGPITAASFSLVTGYTRSRPGATLFAVDDFQPDQSGKLRFHTQFICRLLSR